MAYGLIYRSEWKMMNDSTIIRVDICDTDTVTSDPPTIINMTPTGEPLVISIIDNDRNKYKQIKSRQAKIQVLTNDEIRFETFADAPDDKYIVYIYINPDTTSKTLFYGYLSLADNQVDFLPDPNVLVLTATDHLGMLKDIPLTTAGGLTPTGKNKMIEYLSWSLQKTGFQSPIYVVNNLRHGMSALTQSSTFSSSGQYITISGLTEFFYIGQNLTISGTTSNNGTVAVTNVDNSGSNTKVYIDATIIAETAASAVYTDTSSDEKFYEHYLDAKTFEDEIGTCEDCYSVIEKILGYDCFITQYNGGWWIFRIDEWDQNQIYVTEYDYTGTYVSDHAPTDYNFTFGREEDNIPVLADMILESERPHGTVKLTYNYVNPKEIPCNVDFERGELIGDDGTEVVDDVTYTRKKYALDCWDKLYSGASGDEPATVDIKIKRLFNELDYEAARYVNIPAVSGHFTFIMSEAIPVEVGDMFDFSVTRRLSGNPGGSGSYRDIGQQIRLYADDGTYWTCRGGNTGSGLPRIWSECDSTFTTNQRQFYFEGEQSDDQTEPMTTYDSEGLPFPRSGVVKLLAFQSSLWGASYDTKIDKVEFTYYPKINGTYSKYNGQYQKITRQPTKYLAKLDDTIYINDSPKPIFKGSIFRQVSTDIYKLTKTWWVYNVFPTGLAGHYDASHTYGQVQIRSVMNQYRDAVRIFTGSINGLAYSWPDLIHKYAMSDVDNNTNDRYFMLVSFEQNWKTGFMQGTWIEVWKSPGKVYDDTREFKYISE